MAQQTDERQDRINRREALIKKGIEPHPARFDSTHTLAELTDVKDGEMASVCGRIMLQRVIGKLAFYQLQDESGKHQIGVKVDDVGADNYELTDLLDRGDFLGVTGTKGVTKT